MTPLWLPPRRRCWTGKAGPLIFPFTPPSWGCPTPPRRRAPTAGPGTTTPPSTCFTPPAAPWPSGGLCFSRRAGSAQVFFCYTRAWARGGAVFLEAGGFDADFFMYHEDVDLGWRLWLQGYKILYVPSALVYHKQGGSFFGDRAPLYFLNERNALFTVIKNCGDAWLARLLPLLLFWIVERTGRYLQMDPQAYGLGQAAARLPQSVAVSPAALAGVAAVMDVIRHLPRMLEKRAAIQARRARTDEEIATLFELPPDVFVQIMLR